MGIVNKGVQGVAEGCQKLITPHGDRKRQILLSPHSATVLITPHGDRKHGSERHFNDRLPISLPLMGIVNTKQPLGAFDVIALITPHGDRKPLS